MAEAKRHMEPREPNARLPGREAISAALLAEEGPLVEAGSLLLAPDPRPRSEPAQAPAADDLDLERLELGALVRALERARGNLTRAGALLGLSRDTVRKRMRKLGVRVETRVVVEHPGGD